MAESTTLAEQNEWNNFVRDFYTVAILQGRFAYFLMSFRAVKPNIFNFLFTSDIYPYLWANMVYGITLLIFSRPSLKTISPLNRLTFGILGSLMFNHSSLVCWNWLVTLFSDRPYLLTFLGFFSGRIMIVHLLAFLYHIDTRTKIPDAALPRDEVFEGMYSRSA